MPRELRVFVASPSDMTEERALVRSVAERANSIVGRTFDVRLQVTGWEDIPPDAGRPQDLINPLVDECEVFIGLLHRRWGSETGRFTSGFEEEFERATKRRGSSDDGVPRIALYFRSLDAEVEADAGPQLVQVLAFKDRVRREHRALYREYGETADLERELIALMVGRLAEAAGPSPGVAEGQSGPTDVPAASDVLPRAGDHEPNQAERVLQDYVAIMRGADLGDRRLDPDRLLLFAIGANGRETVPAHALNRLYRRLGELDLLMFEGQAWVRTLVADSRTGPENMTIPGWKAVGAQGGVELIKELARDPSDAHAADALRMLAKLQVPVGDVWGPADPGSDISGLTEHMQNSAAGGLMEYLGFAASEGDLDTLIALQRETSNPELDALVASIRGDTEPLIELIVNGGMSTPSWEASRLLNRLDDVSAESLRKLATSRGRDFDELRRRAFGRLIDLEEVTDDLLVTATTNEALGLTEMALAHLKRAKRRSVAAGILASTKGDTSPDAVDLRSRLLAIAGDEASLRETAKRIYGMDDWVALLSMNVADGAQMARRLLRGGFEGWAGDVETPAGAEPSQGVMAYLYSRAAAAAAAHLAAIPRQARKRGDASLLRRQLLRKDRFAGEDVAVAFGEFATRRDAPLLLEAAVGAYRRKAEILDRTFALGAPDFALSHLKHDDYQVVSAALRRLRGAREIDLGPVRATLHHSVPGVRLQAVDTLVSHVALDDIPTEMRNYAQSKSWYYNVVAAFDRVLAAPSPLNRAWI